MKDYASTPWNSIDFEVPSWDTIYGLLLNVAEKVRKSRFEPDVIVGVGRGGWVPARVMSDLLGNTELANVTAKFYVGVAETKQEPAITQQVSISVKDKKALVVDDLADTGKSLKLVKEHLQSQGASEVKIATIYYKPWSVTVPDFYEQESRRWIVFPWDQKETVRKIVKKGNNRETVEETKEKLISSGLDRKTVERFIKEIAEEKH
jgi:hypoxanthine phosphoribosyltransferase